MALLNKIVLTYFHSMLKDIELSRKDPISFQRVEFEKLIKAGRETFFGKEHSFDTIKDIKNFQKHIPIRAYDEFQPYIDRVRSGEDYILWNQKVKWFAKSSGTSSDKSKYIPITKDNLAHCHMSGFKQLLSSYLNRNPHSEILSGKALTLGGSVQLDKMSEGRAFNGDLSAILLKNSPSIAELLRTPPKSVALKSNFHDKIERICEICSKMDVTNFSGVPSWNLVLIHRLLEYNNAEYLTDIWPNIQLFMHGGINFEPYREQYKTIIPSDKMMYVENYNASEGYFAFQDDDNDRSMLLSVNNGIFYEFIPLDELEDFFTNDRRDALTLEEVKEGEQYALVLTTNSGLWRYLIGDTIEFKSTYPHKIVIVGRTQLYINAFGEELMISNAEKAIAEACKVCTAEVADYTVAPLYMQLDRKGAHQWAIEFSKMPSDIELFTDTLDRALMAVNSDYEAKRINNTTMLRPVITVLPKGTFMKWMQSRKKLGGQNKTPRLSNDRHIIEQLLSC